MQLHPDIKSQNRQQLLLSTLFLLIGSFSLAFFFLVSLWGHVEPILLKNWAIIFGLVLCLRLFQRLYFYFAEISTQMGLLVRSFVEGLAGLVWGSSAFFFISSENTDPLIVNAMVMFLTGISITGILLNWAIRTVSLVFFIAVLTPIVARLILLQELPFVLMALGLIMFAIIVFRAYVSVYDDFIRFFRESTLTPQEKMPDKSSLLSDVFASATAHTEEKLLFKNIVEDSGGLMVVVTELDGKIQNTVYTNPAFCEFIGIDQESANELKPDDYYEPGEFDGIAQLVSAEDKMTFSTFFRSMAGEKISVGLACKYLLLSSGKQYLIAYASDNTKTMERFYQQEEKKKNIAVLKKEQEYQWIAENLPYDLIRFDENLNVNYVHLYSDNVFGLQESEILDRSFDEVFAEHDKPTHVLERFVKDVKRVFQTAEPLVTKGWVASNKKRIYSELRYMPDLEEDGSVSGVLVMKLDNTEAMRIAELMSFLAKLRTQKNKRTFLDRLVRFLRTTLFAEAVVVQVCEESSVSYSIPAASFYRSGGISTDDNYSLKNSIVDKVKLNDFLEFSPKQNQSLYEHDALLRNYQGCSGFCFSLPALEANLKGFITFIFKDDVSDNNTITNIPSLVLPNISAEINRLATIESRVVRQREFETLVENSPDYIARIDREGFCKYINTSLLSLFNEGSVLSRRAIPLTIDNGPLADFSSVYETVTHKKQEQKINIVVENQRTGSEIHLDVRAVPEFDTNGEFSSVLCIGRDITDRIKLEQNLRMQASLDVLTGLLNRRMFLFSLEKAIIRANRKQESLALLFIDLDRFKEINDSLGHKLGDSLLVETAGRIKRCVRSSDIVARFGGDEFVVLLSENLTDARLQEIAQSLIEKLAQSFELQGNQKAYVSASIGIACYPSDSDNFEDLISCADQAMYAAKQDGKDCYRFFTPEMKQITDNRLELANDLRAALKRNEFHLVYQPIMGVKTDSFLKVEALVRWQHSEKGSISPGEFIPLAEETGLIVHLGNWVFREAVEMAARWRRQSEHKDVQITINISPRQFREEDLLECWMDCLAGCGLPPECVVIELTESLLLADYLSVREMLAEISRTGMNLALDDFGTGYSAMAYLKQFNIDYLKIDSSFVRDLESDENDRALAETIIVMASKMGIMSIAEGVETEAQYKMLKDFGCDFVQGYLFSKPLCEQDFLQLISHKSHNSKAV